jgi:hypothetical protein
MRRQHPGLRWTDSMHAWSILTPVVGEEQGLHTYS